jgi:hypothetical protein
MAGADDLARQPWAPLRPGDVVLLYLPDPPYGQTFLAVPDETDVDGHAMMREVSRTDEHADTNLAGFYELWFEAGAHALTVIRAGAVVHGSPAREAGAEQSHVDIPGWEGSIGPFPGGYGKPHVYARNVHSGAGNCVCGRVLPSVLHVQAAPGVPVPGRETSR